jgi:hypothetical protein
VLGRNTSSSDSEIRRMSRTSGAIDARRVSLANRNSALRFRSAPVHRSFNRIGKSPVIPATAVLVRATTESRANGSTQKSFPYIPPQRNEPGFIGEPVGAGSSKTLKPKPNVHPGSNNGAAMLKMAFVVMSWMFSGFNIELFPLRNASRKIK